MKYTPHKSSFFYSLLLLFTAMIWGFGFIVVKNSLDYIPTSYLLAFRFSIGFLGMILVFPYILKDLSRAYLKQGMVLGGFLFLAFTFQIEAVNYTTVGKNAFLTAAYVVFVPLFHWLIHHKKPSLQIILATLLCFTGIGILSIDSSSGINLGDCLTIVCACFYALHIVFSDQYFETGSSPVLLNVLQLGFAAVYAWIVSLLTNQFPKEVFHQNVLVGIFYLGICCTMLAFLFQAIGQKHTSPATASIILCTESVFGVIFSTIFLHEKMNFRMLLGCTTIFIALILTQVELKTLFHTKKE